MEHHDTELQTTLCFFQATPCLLMVSRMPEQHHREGSCGGGCCRVESKAQNRDSLSGLGVSMPNPLFVARGDPFQRRMQVGLSAAMAHDFVRQFLVCELWLKESLGM